MLTEAFNWLGVGVTWLEVWAFALSLGMVACNILVLHWGWPLAFVASVLYGWLFASSKLYGEAALQVFFALMAIWGWRQWLPGTRAAEVALTVRHASRRLLALCAGASVGLVVVFGWFLGRFTDSDVPWWDALPTGLSVVAQVLLARKIVANWWLWAVVNCVSMGLFAYKGLYLTVLLYGLFSVLSIVGAVKWHALVRGERA